MREKSTFRSSTSTYFSKVNDSGYHFDAGKNFE